MNRIPADISRKVLSVGCEYDPPKGGVAQVLYTYSNEVYPVFNCVINSSEGAALKKLFLFFAALLRMRRILAADKDLKIVHIHTASFHSFERSVWFMRLARAMKRKVVLHIHGGGFKNYYLTKPAWISKQLHKADYILALTDGWRSFYENELHLSHVMTVPNVVASPKVSAPAVKDGKIHLLFLGHIVQQKGIFDLLDVVNENKGKWNGKLILHIGGSHEVERLQRFIRDNELDDLVKFHGWVSGEKKAELQSLMDAFVLPSYVEGMPISILESLSYGKPVITTPVGGIPETVNDANGFLFTPGDKTAMADIIDGIINNPSLLTSKSVAAIESVRRNSPSYISSVLEKVYNDVA